MLADVNPRPPAGWNVAQPIFMSEYRISTPILNSLRAASQRIAYNQKEVL